MPLEDLKLPRPPRKLFLPEGNTAESQEHPQMGTENGFSELKQKIKRKKGVSFSEELIVISDDEDWTQVEVECEIPMALQDVADDPNSLAKIFNFENTSAFPLPPTIKQSSPNYSLEDSNRIKTLEKYKAEETDLPPKLPPRGLSMIFNEEPVGINEEINLLEAAFKNKSLGGHRSPRNLVKLPPPVPPKPEKRIFNVETPKVDTDSSNSSAVRTDANFKQKNKRLSPRPTAPPPVPPLNSREEIASKSDLPDINSKVSTEFAAIVRDLLSCEHKYMEEIQEGIKIADRFQEEHISQETINKFFGFFEEIHRLHEQLYEELQVQTETPRQIAQCFLKHVPKFDIYIERQWLAAKESDLGEFEKFLLDSQKLKRYLNLTQQKTGEYLKKLEYLRLNCKRENGLDVVENVIRAVEDLYYQLEMVERLKKIDDLENKVRDSGKVYLDHAFKISVNGNTRKPYLVYFCEKKIIFTTPQTNGIYQYAEDLLTSACYFDPVNNQTTIFEIGLTGRKRFTIKAESQTVKKRWCEKMKKVLRDDQFQD